MLSSSPPPAFFALPPGQTPGAPLPSPPPPDLASHALSVAVSPFPGHPSSKTADDREKTPVQGSPAFVSGGLPPAGSGILGAGGLSPSPGSNGASLGLGSAVVASARPPSTGPGHNHNPNASPAIGSASSPGSYSPPRSPIPSETPAPSSLNNGPLNVKDALSYLEKVRVEFQDKPGVYSHFLDIMKDSKSQAIDTPRVIDRVSRLFNGHTALIQGFNTFLPKGYRIDCTVTQDNHNLITITTPSGTTTRATDGSPRSPHRSLIPSGTLAPSSPNNRPPNLKDTSLYLEMIRAKFQDEPGVYIWLLDLLRTSQNPGYVHSGSFAASSPKDGQVTEHDRAMNYINEIKQRFASDPDTYKQFLEILQACQKGQCTIAEARQQVSVLFNDQQDLLEAFQRFWLDDGASGGERGAGMDEAGSSGNGEPFGTTAQMAGEGSWGHVDDKGDKGEAPGGSGGISSKAGGSDDRAKHKDDKEREWERERDREREQERRRPRKEHEERKKGNAENSIYNSNPNQRSTSHLAGKTTLPAPNDSPANKYTVTIGTTTPSSMIIDQLVQHGCRDITRDLNNLSCSEYPISQGGFGDVYRGHLENGLRVAIKCLRLFDPDDELRQQKHLKDVAREIHTWSRLQHPHVLKLLGLAEYRARISMVSPWVEGGPLRKYLARAPSTNRPRLCARIADGLSYLHECEVIHGDLKGDNVLISDSGEPLLTDFGNAILQEQSLKFTSTSTRNSLSPRWAAPELFRGGSCSFQADIFALGMTILEAMTGDVPHAMKTDLAVVLSIATNQLPERPEAHIPSTSKSGDILWSLLNDCWALDPEMRPKAAHVRDKMRGIEPDDLVAR